MENLKKSYWNGKLEKTVKSIALSSSLLCSTLLGMNSCWTTQKISENKKETKDLIADDYKHRLDDISFINTKQKVPHSLEDLKQIVKLSDFFYSDIEGNILVVKDNLLNTMLSDYDQPWYVKANGKLKVKRSQLEYLQDRFNRFSPQIISVFDGWKYENLEDLADDLMEIENTKVYLSDITETFMSVIGQNKVEVVEMFLKILKSKPWQKTVLVIFNEWKKGLIALVEKNYKEILNGVNEKVDSIVNIIKDLDLKPHMAEWFSFSNEKEELIAKIYYYVVNNYKYCVECLQKEKVDQSGYEMLRTGKGVCMGFAKVMVYFANKLGITDAEVISGLSYGISSNLGYPHAWVEAKIGEEKYVFDPTNENFIQGKTMKFGETNFFKVPMDVADVMFDPKTFEQRDNKEKLENFIKTNGERIKKDKENKVTYWIHNSPTLKRKFDI